MYRDYWTLYWVVFMYSGGFQTQIEKDQLDQVCVVMEINLDTFSWDLNTDESFYIPEVILSCSLEGTAKLSQQFNSIIRHNICRGKYKVSKRPVLINNWEATYFDFDDNKILDIVKEAYKIGIDMLGLDDGWFGKRDNDLSGLGDWYVNEDKFHEDLAGLISKINDMGMKFGLWNQKWYLKIVSYIELIQIGQLKYQEEILWEVDINLYLICQI